MSKILAVGIATIDIVNEVHSYPHEDSEIRSMGQTVQRGGNATNTLIVLSQLGHHCFWAGTIANDLNFNIITNDLDGYQIDYTHATIIENSTNPTSYILHSCDTASRSIVHYRDLKEFDFSSFIKINLQQFNWIHFEGRNVESVFLMQKYCKDNYPDIKISVEIEKDRTHIHQLYDYADVIFFSKPYAINLGYQSANEFLLDQKINIKNKLLSCTWGDKGASLVFNGKLLSHPACKPKKIIDTLAAGDTYNAAMIHLLSNTHEFSEEKANEILGFSCQLAGEKCGQKGIHFEKCMNKKLQ